MACLGLSKLWKFNILTVCWCALSTVQNLIRIYLYTRPLVSGVEVCVCETVFGIVYRGSASRKVCESFLWDTQYKMVTQEEDGVQQVIFTGLKNVWCQRLHSFKTLALNISLAPPDMCDIICYSMEMSPGDRKWWVMLTQVITATDQS